MRKNQRLSVTAGDDLTLEIEFFLEGRPYFLPEGDELTLLVDTPNGERRIEPSFVWENAAEFYISCDRTRELAAINPEGEFPLRVKIDYAGGGEDMPIRQKILRIRGG